MDTVSATRVADTLGVSLPAVHALFDRAGVPAVGRGRSRVATKATLDEAIRARGAVPLKFAGLTRSELLVLAALSRAPLGVLSARELARKAGVSPTVAARALPEFQSMGLVEQRSRVIPVSGRAHSKQFWALNRRSAAWNKELKRAVRAVILPTPTKRTVRQPTKIPARLYHHFWNADLTKLNIHRDGSYIAGRLLAAPDIGAAVWALQNLPATDIHTASTRRGVDEQTRSLISNWENSEFATQK